MLRRHFGEPPHKTRRPSPPSTPLGRRGSPGRTPPQGGPLPRTAPTRATAPPRPGQRSWRALAPRLRGAPPPPGQRTGAARARRAPRQRGGGLAATLVEPPERCRATRRHHYGAERRVAAPRHGHLRERPPSGRSLRHGTACCAKPSATPGVKPTAAAHQRRRLQRAQTSKKKKSHAKISFPYAAHWNI